MKVIKLLFLIAKFILLSVVLLTLLYLFFMGLTELLSKPDIKKNSSPKKRYEVTLGINDAPGPFDSVTGFVQYEVKNQNCVPITGMSLNPLRHVPETDTPLIFHRVSDNVYRATMFTDQFVDEDYFDLGICHWEMTGVVARLKIKNLTLTPGLQPDEVSSQKEIPTYFDRGNYARNKMERNTFGFSDPSKFEPELRNSLFSITLSAKEDMQ